MTNIPSQVFNISLHCVVLFTFLTIFYWNFIVYEEIGAIDDLIEENVIDNLNNLLNKNQKLLQLTSPKDGLNKLNPILDPLNKSIHGDNITQDNLYDLNHDKYKSININILLLLYIVFLCILYYLVKHNYDINYKENIILIFLIGSIEGIFFFFIAKQYVPLRDVDINDTMIEIINSLDISKSDDYIPNDKSDDGPKGFIGGKTYDGPKGFIGGKTYDGPKGFIGGKTYDRPKGFIGGKTYDGPKGFIGGKTYDN